MIIIDIINEQEEIEISDGNIELIKTVIKEAAKIEGITSGEVVISLVDNQRIHELNKDFRNIDRPTDVLSFAMNDYVEEDMEIIYDEDDDPELTNALGDIIISLPKTKEQSEEYGHSFERELGFLAVHGFLHLLGYDHDNEQDEKLMFEKQDVILNNIKLLR